MRPKLFWRWKKVPSDRFVQKSREIVGVFIRTQMWRFCKGFDSFVDVKSPRISALFRLVIFEFTAQNFCKRQLRSRYLFQNLVKLLVYVQGGKFGDFIKDLVPLWMSKAHAYQLCFAWSSSNLLLKRLLRPRDSFHIFHTDNNGWKLDTQSILTSATSFQSPFFVHTFQYNLNAEPSTIFFMMPSRTSKKFRVVQ